MPKLGDVKLNIVYSEDRDKRVTTTDHPIENGFKIIDHVQKEPVILKISGVCTGSDATTRLQKLEKYQSEGKRLTYVGRYYITNMLIDSISTTKDVEVEGTAYKFDISLKQTRIVKTASTKKSSAKTKPKTNAGKKQATKKGPGKRTYVVKRGDTLSEIAQKYYGHGTSKYYMKIYNANKKVIGSNPNKIQVGMKLIIP